MPQMTNVQGIKIRDRIEKMFGKADADEFAAALPLSESADYIHKFKWAKDVCNYLESKYSPEQIKTLRKSCSCHPRDQEKENMKRIYNESENLNEFCEKYNSEYANIHPIWNEGEILYFSYPTCYCSCIKRVNEQISTTWCLCTIGYTKDLFDYVLGCDTEVKLLESVKTGGNRCIMKIIRK